MPRRRPALPPLFSSRSILMLQLVLASFLLSACAKHSRAPGSPAPSEEPAGTLVSEKDGAEMVYIPPGEFLMGSSDQDIQHFRQLFPLRNPAAFEDERPQRIVSLDGYYIDRLEVTNTRFKKFLSETGYVARSYLDRLPFNGPELPAVVLQWEDAVAYANWAGKRLPSEAEWEKAARGAEGRIWPWGDEWDPKKLSGNDGTGAIDGYPQAAPVGSFPQGASPYGVLDMAGNVWEWVADWYEADYYGEAPDENPKGPDTGDGHVLRGGGWAESLDFTRCANRQGGNPGSILRGFRCAMDVPSQQ